MMISRCVRSLLKPDSSHDSAAALSGYVADPTVTSSTVVLRAGHQMNQQTPTAVSATNSTHTRTNISFLPIHMYIMSQKNETLNSYL